MSTLGDDAFGCIGVLMLFGAGGLLAALFESNEAWMYIVGFGCAGTLLYLSFQKWKEDKEKKLSELKSKKRGRKMNWSDQEQYFVIESPDDFEGWEILDKQEQDENSYRITLVRKLGGDGGDLRIAYSSKEHFDQYLKRVKKSIENANNKQAK